MVIPENFKSRSYFLSNEIDNMTVKGIIKGIYETNMSDEELQREDSSYFRKPINLILNTPGGDVYDGLALIGAIELSITPVHITVLGSAMSMGLFILASGHRRIAHRLSTLMYHEISSASWDKIEGMKNDLQEAERIQILCENLLYSRTNIRKKDLLKYRRHKSEWYITPTEALRMGIIDEIAGNSRRKR